MRECREYLIKNKSDGWKKVTDAVHAFKRRENFCSAYAHVSRISTSELNLSGQMAQKF